MPNGQSVGKQDGKSTGAGALSSLIQRVKAELPLCDAQRAGEELYGSPRLSVFDLLSPNELSLTRVIADLFDPSGTHGQGPLFLNGLLREIEMPALGWRDVVRIDREVVLPSKRRIDLVIEGSDFIIGIENKPWAAQQNNQLAEYHDYLKKCAGHRKFAFIFVSDQEEQSAHGRIYRLPYFASIGDKSLYRVLKNCHQHIKAERARQHLADFTSWIARSFGDESMSGTFDKPYREMVQNMYQSDPGARKAIASILLSASDLHRNVINELGESLAGELRKKIRDIEIVGTKTLFECIDEKWSPWLLRRTSWPKNCHLALEADQWSYEKILVGVRALDPLSKEGKKNPDLCCRERKRLDLIANSMQGGGQTSWWPWRRYLANGSWGLPYVGRLLVESDGSPNKHPHLQDLSSRLLILAEAVDAVLQATEGAGSTKS